MGERPHRHLCPEADQRDAMTDAEFWQHVAESLSHPCPLDIDDEPPVGSLDASPCPECGEVGACAYDSEGRALIHTTTDTDHGGGSADESEA